MRRRGSVLLAVALGALSACGGSPASPAATATATATAKATPTSAAPRNAAPSSEDPPLAAKIDPIFASLADAKARSPGCAVGVYAGGTIVFAKGYGSASLENDVPIGRRTSFEIGSMSKQFTATAILLLAEDGKLKLDDDVRMYIKELPDYGHPITLRQLLHHTGGLREYDALLDLSGWDPSDVASEEEALRLLAMQRGVNFAPGTAWSYSNTGYFLLGQVVRRVSGASLAAFSKERIFTPLGMNDTMILDDHTLVVPRHATGYSPRKEGGYQVNVSSREMTGEGNVQSTIDDMARWDANFYDPKVGGRAWLDAMRTPGKLTDGSPLTYAMGLIVRTRFGLPEETHSGGWAGYLSDGRRYPTKRLSVTVLCNRDDVNPMDLTQSVAAAMLPEAMQTEPTETTGRAKPGARTAPAPISNAEGTSLAGAYIEMDGLTVRTFAMKDGALQMGFGLPGEEPRPPVPMARVEGASFQAPGAPSKWTFEPANGKAPAHVRRTAPSEATMTFERFEPEAVDATKAAAYVGRYESAEMTTDYEVAWVDGKLLAAPWGKRHMAQKLSPVARDVFGTGGGYGLVFSRNGKGTVTEMVAVFDGHHAVRWTKR